MIKVEDILNICNGTLICGRMEIECKHFSKDTRNISRGDVFVGIKGDVYNGNNFYIEAFKNGASVCILDDISVINDKKGTIILVDNTILAIQKLAKYKREMYNIPVIAITGSVGKTSVKDMICKVVSSKYKTLCTSGNMNNHIGLPLTILGLDNHEVIIVEMGMNHFGEIHALSNIAKPTMAVITNIGTAHIGNLGSRENILKAKLEILDGMNDGYLFINNDNDLLRTIKYDNLVTVGINNNSDYMAKNINEEVFSSNFYIDDCYIKVPVGGLSFVYNSLFAYAVGKKLNITDTEISKSLLDFKLASHRLEVINCNNMTVIDDTYNANFDSVKNAISVLEKVEGRKVFIFADILELNEFSKDIHTNIGKMFKESNINILITIGNETKYTYFENPGSYHFDNNKDLLKSINTILNKGDTILIKGSHSMNLLEIVEYLKRA